ncbi:MAG: heterodisulfide reductase-related iron-sulfur binding cluster [Bacteroidota bacterium]|nr:heterodisulfide reductase-related iron-sulfur binding cluster [Bacteroidota bacterium]
MISSIIFTVALIATIGLFSYNVRIIRRNIKLGISQNISDNKKERWRKMFLTAIGQSKMTKRPIAGVLHIIVYVGFLLVNIEMIEILIDGIAGTHRVLSFIGEDVYNSFAGVFEVFATLVLLACAIFLIRRNVLKIGRFHNKEMTAWPRLDANIILITEILLMTAFLSMNAADTVLMERGHIGEHQVGPFLISQMLVPWFSGFSAGTLHFIEQFGWWFHIIGVFAFLNYIPYSKHFHVFSAFPNVWYSKLGPQAVLSNMSSVTKEVKIMLGAMADDGGEDDEIPAFGAKDIRQLSQKNLMDSYTCTECGRCTAVCPANNTGKKLSPRKIVMAVRDRTEEVGKGFAKEGSDFDDGKSLLGDYISQEELWACTTCNACVEECPVCIDPVSIIMELRRHTFLEESAAPTPINSMSRNIENNGAPWQYSAADRFNWATGIENNKGDAISVPLMSDKISKGEKPEYLFWVGSAGSFDERAIEITRSFIKILDHANVDYACLGTEETDSGDNAKRAGNEFLYQMQAMTNIELLNNYEVKKIVTCDPHDFNLLKNEYSGLGGNYEVIHHSQLIEELIRKKLISSKPKTEKTITYHDPCYLGRGNEVYDAPRAVVQEFGRLKEMENNKKRSVCCGAGGTQMFKEAEKGNSEVYEMRTEEALETGCDIIATACPFCMTMITDGIKMSESEKQTEVLDIAEITAKNLQ